jgi:hypothetical protein
MPKPPDSPKPDPLAREVDRLLAGLSTLGGEPEAAPRPPIRAPRSRPTPARRRTDPTRRNLAALWARVVLGIVLGAMITQWPYPHGCGLGLLQYLGAVAMVMVTGTWIAVTTWSRRHAAGHIFALLLMLWGIALVTYETLPRVGYAALRWSWQC